MLLESLRVLNLSKSRTVPSEWKAEESFSRTFHLDSCQRLLWICRDRDLESIEIPGWIETYSGKTAYAFLLRVATGLESQVLGETDIFGQLKEAWKKYDEGLGALATELKPWIQRVFEDTKEIRSLYLHHQGGTSYGSLVRQLLADEFDGPVLLVGAGQLAQSVAPYLTGKGLMLSNRTRERLEALRSELTDRGATDVTLVEESIEARAWSDARAIVLCIPFDPAPGRDEERVKLLRSGRQGKRLIHLGGLRRDCGVWGTVPGLLCLDDLFELQKSQNELRTAQVGRAARACEMRAKLRLLGNSVSIPHGWEDLAVFA